MAHDPAGGTHGKNPDWSRDETILLMELYLKAPKAGRTNPAVVALSAVLRAAGRREERAIPATFRNPAGIAMRLRNFGQHDPNAPAGRNPGLKPGGAVDAQVWCEFGSNRAALTTEVVRIRNAISAEQWQRSLRSSRGPAPAYGPRASVVSDGRTGVYLLVIDGPLEILAPDQDATDGWSVVKVGRTADLERRMGELVSGLPPGAGIRYVPIAVRMFPTGIEAHDFERSVLDACDLAGWSLGGEFAHAPIADISRMLAA